MSSTAIRTAAPLRPASTDKVYSPVSALPQNGLTWLDNSRRACLVADGAAAASSTQTVHRTWLSRVEDGLTVMCAAAALLFVVAYLVGVV